MDIGVKHFFRLISSTAAIATIFAALWPSLASAEDPGEPQFAAAELDFFEKRVRPILVARCFECHASTSEKVQGGLLLDSRAGVLKGGDTGAAAIAGRPEKSLLLKAVGYDSEDIQMPPAGKLPSAEIEVLTHWIKSGIAYPRSTATAAVRRSIDLIEGRMHWAFQPLTDKALPIIEQQLSKWPVRRIDAFILQGHEEHALAPAAAADRRALIRRAKFDLLGLPPEPDEVAGFVVDPDPQAYEKLVDRYLASPQYGERWGRYWLDLSRYCDVPESWREGDAKAWLYRDWVVQSLNDDVPYDRFVRQQFAADLLPNTNPHDNAALGFLGLSPTYWKELKLDHLMIKQVVAEEWEERIEAVGATFLGLTIACARCHDHKFDPISVQDYYGLAGVLASIQLDEKPIVTDPEANIAKQGRLKIKELEEQIKKLSNIKLIFQENRQKVAELRQEIERIRRETPHIESPLAFGVVDASLHVLPDGPSRTKLEYKIGEAQNVAVQIRGNASNPGPLVQRRFLSVLSADSGRSLDEGSGRLQLAEAIVTDAAPLAARVFVNRVWLHHFGRGLVTTPSNFGEQGDRPSHPELLDDLAFRFIEHGWSFKWLHREIMLSATYQQASVAIPAVNETPSGVDDRETIDPENIWLARMPLRRLDVEAWRDAILAATDELDLRIGGEPMDLQSAGNRRRTVYGTVKRRELADLLRLHDFPDPVAHSAYRTATTTPLQQLFVLNSPFLRERSVALSKRVTSQMHADDPTRIRWLYRVLFGREAASEEVTAATAFLAAAPSGSSEELWIQYCHVLLGSNEMLFVE